MAVTDPKSTTKPEDTTTSAAPAKAPAAAPSAGAGSSGDPNVQRLLAIKQGHQMNRDLLDPPVVDKAALDAADEAIAEVDDQLADLGFPQESQADRKARLEKAAADAAKAEADAAKRREDRAAAREKAHASAASA
jgi:hypothetical protein